MIKHQHHEFCCAIVFVTNIGPKLISPGKHTISLTRNPRKIDNGGFFSGRESRCKGGCPNYVRMHALIQASKINGASCGLLPCNTVG